MPALQKSNKMTKNYLNVKTSRFWSWGGSRDKWGAVSPPIGEIWIFTLVFPTSYVKSSNVKLWMFVVGMHFIVWLYLCSSCFALKAYGCTCAVSVCQLINGSQFPILIFVMSCQWKLNKPDVHHPWTIFIDCRIMFGKYF